MHLIEEFLKVARKLNEQHGISPLLYGSLGLEQVTESKLDPRDIDVLIPLVYLEEKWNKFNLTMESLGFQLVNLKEPEFHKGDIKIAFFFIEDEIEFAEINIEVIQEKEYEIVRYKQLNLDQFRRKYEKSICEGYRIN